MANDGDSHKIMSAENCRNKCTFSFRRNVSKDVADVKKEDRSKSWDQLSIVKGITEVYTIGKEKYPEGMIGPQILPNAWSICSVLSLTQ